MQLQIGILMPQGGFDTYPKAVDDAYATAIAVDGAGQLESLDGLIIEGNDAISLLHLLQASKLFDELRVFGQRKPILAMGAATCLLARKVESPAQASLGLMDIAVESSGYLGQIDHLMEMLRHEFDDESGALLAVFDRPPIIRSVGREVNVLAKHKGDPVLVDEGLHMAATFHPELVLDRRICFHFIDKVRENYWRLRL